MDEQKEEEINEGLLYMVAPREVLEENLLRAEILTQLALIEKKI